MLTNLYINNLFIKKNILSFFSSFAILLCEPLQVKCSL